jgi:hypothetical protein
VCVVKCVCVCVCVCLCVCVGVCVLGGKVFSEEGRGRDEKFCNY